VGEWDFELRPVRPGVEAEDARPHSESPADGSARRDVPELLEELIVRIDELANSVDRVNRRLAAIEQNGTGEVPEGESIGNVASRRLREARIARRLAGPAAVASTDQAPDPGAEPAT
jgi:hypothetical protein